MKCPFCNSSNVEESELSLFESDPINSVAEGFDLFGIKAFAGIIANGAKKIELSLNNKKRYLCLDCRKLFEA